LVGAADERQHSNTINGRFFKTKDCMDASSEVDRFTIVA
jgi:hypothetical protein